MTKPTTEGTVTPPQPILNGDHAEFEQEWAGKPLRERPGYPYCSFDAMDWAKSFCEKFPTADEGLMLAWFSSALMRGFDEGGRRAAISASGRDGLVEAASREAQEKTRFNAAEKVENWDGAVYAEGYGWNDGYFTNLEELHENLSDEECPEYVWCCSEQNIVDVCLGTLTDNMEMADGQDLDDLKGVKEIEAALEAFNKANESFVMWMPDYKRCVLIEKEVQP